MRYAGVFVSRRAAMVIAAMLLATVMLVVQASASAVVVQTVDSAGNVGMSTSLALDPDGNPHISYYRSINWFDGDLKYAVWNGTAWAVQTVDNSEGQVGVYNSLALDQDGYFHISYHDGPTAT